MHVFLEDWFRLVDALEDAQDAGNQAKDAKDFRHFDTKEGMR